MTNDDETMSELSKHLTGLSREELLQYERATANTGMIINLVGVAIIFFAMLFPITGVVVAVAIAVYFLAHIGIGVNMGLKLIRTHISKAKDTDK